MFFNIKFLAYKYKNIIYINLFKCVVKHEINKLYDHRDIRINTRLFYFHYNKLKTKHLTTIQELFNLDITSKHINALIKNKILVLRDYAIIIIDDCLDNIYYLLNKFEIKTIIIYYHDNLHSILQQRVEKHCNIGYFMMLKNYIINSKINNIE